MPGASLRFAAALTAALLAAAGLALPGISRGRGAHAHNVGHKAVLADATPFTPWHKPRVKLPAPPLANYLQLAEAGVKQASRWRRGGWYCELLGCPGAYPMLTIWGGVRMFETADALELAAPSPDHRALVDHFAQQSERYWDTALGGYSPYPGDRAGDVEAWFDDNGWLGLAYVNAYDATKDSRYLYDAQRAFHFIAAHGWDIGGGGGMWWTTNHPYHSGPALSADSLLGALLYELDHESWQLADVKTWVDWANANDTKDERRFYLEKPGDPNSVNDYVQGPLVYAQYLLCKDGQGGGYCVHAARLAATLAEQHVTAYGYHLNYGPQYDSIYLQWMMAYGQAAGDPYWTQLAEVNASAAAQHGADQGAWLTSWWGGPIRDPETHPGMFRTMAATTSLYAWVAAYGGGGA
jgi:glycosyl hydrolase family 76